MVPEVNLTKAKCQVCFSRDATEGSLLCSRCSEKPSKPSRRRRISEKRRKAVFARDDCKCVYCGSENWNVLEIDHKLPLALGGTDEISNLQVACQDCNSRKGQRSHGEYKELLSRRGKAHLLDVESTADIMAKPPGVP